MSDATKIIDHCATLLKSEVAYAEAINVLAVCAFAFGIVLMLRRGWITLQKLEDPKTPDDMEQLMARKLNAVEIKTITEALAALAKALKDTPVGLALIIISLALFYLPTASVGAPCTDILTSAVDAEAEEDQLGALLDKSPTSVTVTKTATDKTTKAEWKPKAKTASEV